ncbi:MAG: hypothetical protein P8012_10995 [Desulfobacterales bacterium]
MSVSKCEKFGLILLKIHQVFLTQEDPNFNAKGAGRTAESSRLKAERIKGKATEVGGLTSEVGNSVTEEPLNFNNTE